MNRFLHKNNMADQKIKFQAWNVSSGKPDLDGILRLYNDSDFSDEVVAEGVREFLVAYAIGYNPKSGELLAECLNAYGGRRQVWIFAPENGNIWLVATKEDAPQTLCESYHFYAIYNSDITFSSKDTKYSVQLGK